MATALTKVAGQVRALGTKRVLILAAPSRRFVDRFLAELAEFSPRVFDGARVHVPIEVVGAALAVLGDADTLVAIGGGAAIGLGKALKLTKELKLVAIPTTYSGSEQTNLYGITRGKTKQTGRDERVRPDLIIYDVELTRGMPIALSVQSLFNAVAHVVSAASTGTAPPESVSAARDVLAAAQRLVAGDETARELAQEAAAICAHAADRGKPGAQHALAHLLGGALGVDHAALHAILLPHFVAHLPADLVAGLERDLGRPELSRYLHDLLARSGAPTTLSALGASHDAIEAALATRPDLPIEIARSASS